MSYDSGSNYKYPKQLTEEEKELQERLRMGRIERGILNPEPTTVMTNYDSTADTLLHIRKVNELLIKCCRNLLARAWVHDNSKLNEPEKSEFDRLTPLLKTLTYGSDEYKASLGELQVALKHHYQYNSHHPEHYENGVNGMDLLDVLEMLMDWKAATERTKYGDILKSIEINKTRFNISDQLSEILSNTIVSMGLQTQLTNP